MRFFEICMAGGLQISSACPEMEPILKEKEHLFYYNDLEHLSTQIESALSSPEDTSRLKNNAHKLLNSEHLYVYRIRKILASPG